MATNLFQTLFEDKARGEALEGAKKFGEQVGIKVLEETRKQKAAKTKKEIESLKKFGGELTKKVEAVIPKPKAMPFEEFLKKHPPEKVVTAPVKKLSLDEMMAKHPPDIFGLEEKAKVIGGVFEKVGSFSKRREELEKKLQETKSLSLEESEEYKKLTGFGKQEEPKEILRAPTGEELSPIEDYAQLTPQQKFDLASAEEDFGKRLQLAGAAFGDLFKKGGEEIRRKSEESAGKILEREGGETLESRAIRSLGGVFAGPGEMIGTGLQSLTGGETLKEEPRIIKGLSEIAFGASLAPIFDSVTSQPEIKPIAEAAFNTLGSLKEGINNLPVIKDLPQEARDAINLGTDLLALKLLHSGVKKAIELPTKQTRNIKTTDPITGNPVTFKIPVDREWWGNFKDKISEYVEVARTEPEIFLEKLQADLKVPELELQTRAVAELEEGIPTGKEIARVEELIKPKDVDKEKFPWETDQEWKERVGELPQERKVITEKDKVTGKEYLKKQGDDLITNYIETSLKPEMGRGVIQGGLMRDEYTGEVTGRFGRQSENPQWYRDFYEENGRVPTEKDLRQIAVEHLTTGYDEYGMPPNRVFLDVVGALKDYGQEIPLEKMKVPTEPTKRPLTIEKEGIRELGKGQTDILDLALQEGVKPEKLRELRQEVAKREAIETAISNGEYSKADEVLSTMKNRTGIINPIVSVLDKGLSLPFKGVKWAVQKAVDIAVPEKWKEGVNHIFRKQQNLDDEVFKVITEKKRAETREYAGIEEMLEPLKKLKKAQKEMVGEYLKGKEVEGLEPAVKESLDIIRREIDIEGLRQVQAGKLDPEVYFKNLGSYMRRLYSIHGSDEFQPLANAYNRLKETLVAERNIGGIEAERQIADILMGNTKDVSGAIRPTGAKQEGDFLKKRKLKDTPVDLAIREFLGEIKDPEYLVARTLLELKQARINQQFLAKLDGTPAMVDSIPSSQADRWVQLKSDQYGMFKGKYLDKAVFEYLQLERQKVGNVMKNLNALNSFIKGNLTVMNLGGQFRNFNSNFAVSQSILGHNFLTPRGAVEMKDTIMSLKDKDGFYDELRAYGQIGNTGIKQELGHTLDEIIREQLGKDPNKLKEWWRKFNDAMGKSYQFGDNVFLMANYKKLRTKGLSPEEAIIQARRVTPDYGDVNPVIDKFRKNLFGVPFMTWRYKVYPELLKSLFEKPLQTTLPVSVPLALGYTLINSGVIPMTDEEKQIATTKLFRDGKITFGRDQEGDTIDVDFGSYTPFADMFKGGQKRKNDPFGFLPDQLYGYVEGSVPGLSSFPLQTSLNLVTNTDPFTGKEIYKPEEGALSMFTDIFAHIAPQVVPVAGSPIQKAIRAAEKEQDVGGAVLEGLTGVKVRSEGVGKFAEKETYRDVDFELNPVQKKLRFEVRDAIQKAGGDQAKEGEALINLATQYPDQEDYILDRFKAEIKKEEGTAKKQKDIRTEMVSIFNLSKIDQPKADKRLEELAVKYPELEDYIIKKYTEMEKENK